MSTRATPLAIPEPEQSQSLVAEKKPPPEGLNLAVNVLKPPKPEPPKNLEPPPKPAAPVVDKRASSMQKVGSKVCLIFPDFFKIFFLIFLFFLNF